ncbi:MAG: hypothetical protein ACYDER_01745 [Ktedonobacteraceae bacterium]
MADNQAISQDDLQSLATKLAEFAKTLTPAEQAALLEQLQQTPAADEDVQGFQYNYLYQKVAEARHADFLREAEQARLAALAHPTRRPGMFRMAIGSLGTLLVGLGIRMKQVEVPQGAATRSA